MSLNPSKLTFNSKNIGPLAANANERATVESSSRNLVEKWALYLEMVRKRSKVAAVRRSAEAEMATWLKGGRIKNYSCSPLPSPQCEHGAKTGPPDHGKCLAFIEVHEEVHGEEEDVGG